MPIFDAGLFVLLLGTGAITMLLSFKMGAVLMILSIVIFFGLSIVMFAQYDIAYTSEFYGTTDCTIADPCVENKYLIRENQNWMAWIFVAFGIFTALLFFLEMIGFFDPTKSPQQESGF
jgi:hypothetical protein